MVKRTQTLKLKYLILHKGKICAYEECNRLIKAYHTRNPFEIAEMMNIEIVYHDLGNFKSTTSINQDL